MRVNLFNVLNDKCLSVSSKAATKKEVLKEIASLVKKSGNASSMGEEEIFSALDAREALGSTGFGDGIAIPHCRVSGISKFTLGIIVTEKEIDFDSLDGKGVRLFIFIIAPDTESDEHIRLLSSISQALRVPGTINEILGSTSCEVLKESFLRSSRDEVDSKDHQGSNLFHVFVQDEDIFDDILEVFAAMDTCSVMVVEASRSGSYLQKLPLFAGFLSDESRGFNNIIVATVQKRLTNDTIRRIEQIAGSLDERKDLALIVQDIFYSAGHLEA
jgi:PTS system nitrogen regulatory IIA component